MISKAENPEKMLNQLIVDMNQNLIESKKSVASAIADEKKLERQAKENIVAGEEWERKAMLAVRAGKEDLAKEALIRKQEFDKLAAQYKEQWNVQHESVEKLKTALRGLQQKIEEAQRKKNLLVARAKRAEAQRKINETIGGLADTSAFEAFEDQFLALEAGGNTEKMLEDLKKKMAIEDKRDKADRGTASSASSGTAGQSSAEVDLELEALKKKLQEEPPAAQ
jgi:phage shock protein A